MAVFLFAIKKTENCKAALMELIQIHSLEQLICDGVCKDI